MAFTFTIDSFIADVWYRRVRDSSGKLTVNDVPNLFNLRAIVQELLDKKVAEE